jgi:hypothetical protein
MDSLVRQAWELYRHTAGFPVETILTAAVWLEEKHRKKPNAELAMVIAQHYLILALRHDGGAESATAETYCACATRWHKKANESASFRRSAWN